MLDAAPVLGDWNISESVTSGAVIVVVVLFLRFLTEYRTALATEQAAERTAYRQTLDQLSDRHDREHVQVIERLEQLAADQRTTSSCLQQVAENLRDRSRSQP